jgi:TolB protein
MFISSCSDEPEASRETNPENPVETPLDTTDHPVVYMSDDQPEGPFDLWLMKEDGSDAQQLTSEPGTEERPDWSPDGKRIAFAGTGTNDTYDLYVINADGTGLRQLTDTGDKAEGYPTWSPDGAPLLYTAASPDEEAAPLQITEPDDARSEPVTVADVGVWGDWSPDGRQILYTGLNEPGEEGEGALWVVNSDGTGAHVLDLPNVRGAYESSWGPDGRIAFVAESGPNDAEDAVEANEDIWLMNPDGTDARKVVTSVGSDHWPPTWSADGSRLMYTAEGTEIVSELAVVDLSTGDVTSLTDNDVYDMMPSWRSSS